MCKGDERNVVITSPAGWRVSELAGESARVDGKGEQVAEQGLPGADEAFIRSFVVKSGGLEQFRTDIRSNLDGELKGALMNRLRRAVGEELVAAYKDVEMPPTLVENEARSMLQQAVEQEIGSASCRARGCQ